MRNYEKSDRRNWRWPCYSWWLEKRRSETGMYSVRASNEDLKKERIKERHEGRKKEKI
jgi:hypothetical protein